MQQLNQLNVILNGVQTTKRSSYGYGYGYGYGYNYGYGYYEGDDEIEKGNILKRLWSFIRSKFTR